MMPCHAVPNRDRLSATLRFSEPLLVVFASFGPVRTSHYTCRTTRFDTFKFAPQDVSLSFTHSFDVARKVADVRQPFRRKRDRLSQRPFLFPRHFIFDSALRSGNLVLVLTLTRSNHRLPSLTRDSSVSAGHRPGGRHVALA